MSDLVPFGHAQSWVAVRNQPQLAVEEALGLTGGTVTEVDEAVRAARGEATTVLPPIPGAGGRWTLVVGQDVEDPSATRIASLSAMLSTGVQLFAIGEGGSWRCLHAERGRIERDVEVDAAQVPATAAEWSVDPTTLTGRAPGSALLVGALRAELPTVDSEPGLVVLPRSKGFWSRLLAPLRRPTDS